jgi:Fur family ferric uptake transcriptional regulator
MAKDHELVLDEARERIREAGLKATTARMRVLAALAGAGGLMSHHDIEQALGNERIDRVTLYRVLESLVAGGLAHRVAGMDRVWRFGAIASRASRSPGVVRAAHDRHAHFQCNDCGKIVCLREVAAQSRGRALRVPRGYRTEAVELTVKGRCPQCAA